MSLHKHTLRHLLAQQRKAIDSMAEQLSENGFICPFSNIPHALGDVSNMLVMGDDGKEHLPPYCSLVSERDYFGEYDDSCTGAKDGQSCWKHYLEVACLVRGPKLRKGRRFRKRLHNHKADAIARLIFDAQCGLK